MEIVEEDGREGAWWLPRAERSEGESQTTFGGASGNGISPSADAAALRHCVVDELVSLSQTAGDEAVLAALLASGEHLERSETFRNELALCLAAGRGDAATMDQLLREGAEINCAPSFGGMTPLMFAAYFGHLGILELLMLQPSLNLNGTTSMGQTALSLCRDEASRRLLAHTAAVRSGDGGRQALLQAACLGHVCTLRRLLEAGTDPNHQDDRGRSALLISAVRRHTEACEVLLAHGADPGPLRLAIGAGSCSWGKLPMMLQLYDAGSRLSPHRD